MNIKVLAFDTFQNEKGKEVADYVKLDFLHCPLFPETQNIINKANIAKIKDGVILINNSRGQLIIESDLAEALDEQYRRQEYAL